ncbi:MAG: DMT family transporter [Okeania sp. SIO3B5]|nr:DMT family transporter [Okeania sp. SIO3B5]
MPTELESPKPTEWQTPPPLVIIVIFIAIFMYSFAAIFIKLSEQDVGPNATVFNRFWIATICLGFWRWMEVLRLRLSFDEMASSKNYTTKELGLLLLGATLAELSQLAWAWSLTETGVANANLLHNFTPVFTAFGGWLLLGHYFGLRFVFGLTLAIVGAITIGLEDWQVGTDNLVGDSLALLSAFFYAMSVLVIEQLRTKFSATGILLWSCLLRSCLTFPLVLLAEDRLFPSSLQGWLAVISLAVLCQVLASMILVHQLKTYSSGFISLFLLLEPIFTAILGWIIFGEQLSFLNWLAFLVVLLGIYLAQSNQGPKKS